MALKIITDSASDLPKQVIEEYHLHVIPTPVVIEGVDYFDGKTIQTKEFYKKLDDIHVDIKTYHINPAMFEEAFLPYAKNGDAVIYLCFSTGIAGTYNAANLAKQSVLEAYPEFDITIIDSKCASAGFGLLVYKLLQMQRNGAPKELLIEAAEYYKQHIKHVFTVNTLAYLVKGGRLSKVKGTIGETLDVRPILIVDEMGSLKMYKSVRGRKKSLHALVDYVKENGFELENQTIAICHGEDETSLEAAKEMLWKHVPHKDDLIETVGCAIGAHTGRGIIGICFLNATEEPYRQYL